MKYSFTATNILTKNAKSLFSSQEIASFTKILKSSQGIENEKQFNYLLSKIVVEVKKIKIKTNNKTNIFSKEILSIQREKALATKTVWGGVVLKKVDVEKDFIRKLLVVRATGILGFEIHRKKLEKLNILEGVCLVLYSNHAKKSFKNGDITIKLATVGDTFTFQPKDEHGIIALSNCVIQETSTNHLDDLVYIFLAKQVN